MFKAILYCANASEALQVVKHLISQFNFYKHIIREESNLVKAKIYI